jgi:hypothetical protein
VPRPERYRATRGLRLSTFLLAALVAAGCSAGNVVPRERVSADEVQSLREEKGLPMYYAGQSVFGLPLTGANGWSSEVGEAFFAYGTCELPEGEGGCPVPVQIQHFRFDPSQWKLAEGCFRHPPLRGVLTARHDGLVLFTESIVVKVYARNSAEERRVVAELRGLNTDLSKGEPLPRPARSVRELVSQVCPGIRSS